ncbi:dynamin family protein [Clostridium sp. SM-530-WT-3G]|uniref:dynamin family protein n=1 Tax=Clostridium sp. SM-530-WT-3G TaxID=2725303 RepID=UPI00145DF374|nr:dynamin family protein [Clostridium sp. SM-530-WT-3G]NME84275.1 dynamin family protein [Clostridium sp. SM-530-WT-3G]
MTYIDLINDKRFNYLLEKYMNSESAGIDYKNYFKHFIENMNKSEIIIPVLGIQGAGKSSFLNSILMDENILPTDVDETTCVPVEVRFGNDTSRAQVHFKGRNMEEIHINDLEKYVHNDYNPANEIGVSKIVIYNNSEILKDNIVLVDLPGVGSLTPENQKTTLDYVNKLVAGIFMIRTNPPITRTEKNFINALWPKLSNTIFVQNKWNDETDEDAEDAKDHNEGVLNGISTSHNDSREVHVNVVNVYEAVKGKFTNDPILYNESGINKVISEIKDISKKYNYNLNETLKIKIEETFKNLEDRIQNFINASMNEAKVNEAEKQKQIGEIKEILSYNKNYFREIRNYANDEMDKIIEEASYIIKENMENLRYNIKNVINRGLVDGEMLSSIYKESSDKAVNNIMDEVLGITSELIINLNKKLNYVTIKGFDGTYENISFFNKESSFKFEKSIPPILGLSTGIIGAVGTVASLGGPLGVLVGMGIGFVFSIIGDSIRKEILSTRAEYTIKDLEPMIEDLENYLREEILDDLRAKAQEVDNSIKELRKKIESTFKEDILSISSQYDADYNEKHTIEFEKDLNILKSLRSMI